MPGAVYEEKEDDEKRLRGQNEMMAQCILKAKASFRKGAVPVLSAHTFASGGLSSDSERVFVGSVDQADISLFEPFAYSGLGHLHRAQNVGEMSVF